MALQNVIEEYIKEVKIDKNYELSLTDIYFDPLGNKITIKTIAEYFYKQALKDMMERIKGVTCYAACCECYMTDDFFTLESLKEIAEDLGK